MTEQLSKINKVFEDIGETITKSEEFNQIPIQWAMFEVTPNNMPPTLIVLEAKPFQYNPNDCWYERQLDILIIHNTNHTREIIKRLTKYAEDLIEVLEQHMNTNAQNYQMEFLNGSEIRALRNNREDTESYKGSKTLFSSLIVLSYLLRY
ncbi:MAG: hypothetical protein UHM08_08840 [Bacteroidales bacterium]|nr:hypothetical protein [Bacteroidales bacterium]